MRGDITRVAVDAIVNAANELMLGGGGVDGAIHAAAGPELYHACRAIPEVAEQVRCPRGEARITPAFRLPARFVIHTAGPYYETENAATVLRRCYESSLGLANRHRLASVAFPAISCGMYGYPAREAAEISVAACQAHHDELVEVRFVLFEYETHQCWLEVAGRMLEEAE